MKLTNQVKTVIKHMLNAKAGEIINTKHGILNINKADIDYVLKGGKEVRLTPKRNVKAKGIIIHIEGDKSLWLDTVILTVETFSKILHKNGRVVWDTVINDNLRTSTAKVIFVY